MKKTLTILACTFLFSAPVFAKYIVVLKNGTRYTAKAKWTVTNGRALVLLENGQSLQLDPALIDVAKSEQLTKIGLANANVIDLDADIPKPKPVQQPSLGSQIKLRRPTQQVQEEAAPSKPSAAAPLAPGAGTMSAQVLDKFQRAYENVGIFEHKVESNGARAIRVELTADTEERVFNAISATSFLMVRNAGVDAAQIDVVELFMRTTTGGSAGRFQMTRADAEALDKRTLSQHEYFIRKVIY
ncbi:MAG TPA: hypothetical protein VE010_00345 [Thermoanaerobaculia bacterium]|nr:hypothetical protein [Thermoanaerobaculia bacterium]